MTTFTKRPFTALLLLSLGISSTSFLTLEAMDIEEDFTENILENIEPKKDEKKNPDDKKAEEKIPEWLEDKEDEVEVSGSEYSGNWYLKKLRLTEARNLYTAIHEIEAAITTKKDSFLKERIDLNNELNAFYISYTFKLSDLDAILEQIAVEIAEYEKEYGDNQEIRETIERLKARKKSLEELKSQLTIIAEYDKQIDKGINTFIEQEELARSYEQGAWASYEKLESAIDDVTSKRLFNEVKAALANIKNIAQYGNQSFTSFLQDIIGKMHTAMKNVQDKLEELKKHGITLQQAVDEAEKKKYEEEIKQKEEAKLKKIAPQKPVQKSWWQKIIG